MSKISSREAYYKRLNDLANVNKTSLKETKNSSLGTLIDYKRSAEGIAYGIIKENHNYYIKKAGIKSDPDISDFAYIGGLANITNYQYKSLSEADKNRSMLLHTINEAASLDFRKKNTNEDKAEDEIESAEAQLDNLDAATAAEKTPDEEMAAGLDAEPAGIEDTEVSTEEIPADGGEEIPADGGDLPPEGGEEMPADGGEEIPADGGEESPEGDGIDADDLDDKNDPIKEIEKEIGKVTNKIRKSELEPNQVKSFVNSYLSAFKDKFGDVEIEDRKEMVNKILKVVPPEDVENLGDDVETQEEIDEGNCNECSQFAQYAESMGYDSAQSLMECDEEEVTNLISGFANGKADGENDGDHENVALIIKIINPEILNNLKNDYGHEEYAEELTPHVDQMNEATEEESMQKLDELFGNLRAGLKGAGNVIKNKLGNKAQQAKDFVGDKTQQAKDFVGDKTQQAKDFVGDKAQQAKGYVDKQVGDVKKGFHGAVANVEQKKAEDMANKLAQQIKTMNDRREKAGKESLNIASVLSIFSNQLKAGSGANLAGSKLSGSLEEVIDPAGVEVQPEPEPDTNIAPAADNLGVATPSENTTVTIENGRVEVGLNESKKQPMSETEQKLRKYIRNRLKEKVGMKKPVLNENAKSDKLKKLDEMIDTQFENYNVDEISTGLAQRAAQKKFDDYPEDTLGIQKKDNQLRTFNTYVGPELKNYIKSLGLIYDYYPHKHQVILNDNADIYLTITPDTYKFSKDSNVAYWDTPTKRKYARLIKKIQEILKQNSVPDNALEEGIFNAVDNKKKVN